MPHPTRPLRKLGFLTIGLFDPADPAAGHESTLEIIELGERLGFEVVAQGAIRRPDSALRYHFGSGSAAASEQW